MGADKGGSQACTGIWRWGFGNALGKCSGKPVLSPGVTKGSPLAWAIVQSSRWAQGAEAGISALHPVAVKKRSGPAASQELGFTPHGLLWVGVLIKYPSCMWLHPPLLHQNVAGQLDLARGELSLAGIPGVGLLHKVIQAAGLLAGL